MLSSKVTVCLLAFVGIPTFLVWRVAADRWTPDDLRHAIEAEASFRLKRAVTIGHIGGNPWTGVVLSDVSVRKRPDQPGHDTWFAADRVIVHYRGRDVLRGRLTPLRSVSTIELEGLWLDASKTADGKWNFQDLIEPTEKVPTDRFTGKLLVRNGTVHYRDEQVVSGRGCLDITPTDVDLTADFADADKATFSATAAGGSEPIDRIDLSGEIGAGGDRYPDYQDFHLAAYGVDLPYAVSHIVGARESINMKAGRATIEGTFLLGMGIDPVDSLSVAVSGARFALPGVDGDLTFDGPLASNGDNLATSGGTLGYGRSTARVSGSLLGLGSSAGPLCDARLDPCELDPADITRWFGAPSGYRIETGSGPVKGALHVVGSPLELVVEGRLDTPALSVSTPEGWLATSPRVALAGRVGDTVSLAGEVAVSPGSMALSVPSLFAPPDWLRSGDTSLDARGQVTARLRIARGQATGEVTVEGGSARLLGTDLTGVSGVAKFTDGGVRVARFSAEADGAHVEGKGSATTSGAETLSSFMGSVDGLDLATLRRWVDLGDTPPEGRASFRFGVGNTDSGADWTTVLKGHVDGLRWGSADIERVTFAAKGAGPRWRFPVVEVSDPKGGATGSLEIEIPEKKGESPRIVAGRVHATGVDIPQVVDAIRPADAKWPEIGGRAGLDGSVAGSLAHPIFYGKVRVLDGSYDGRAFDSLLADVSASDAEIVFGDLELRRKYSTITANGTLSHYLPEKPDVPAEPDLSVTARVQRVSVEDLLGLADQPNTESISGLLYGEVTASGKVGGDMTGSAALTLRDGSWGEWPIREARAEVSLNGTTLDVREAVARADLGGAVAHGLVHDIWNTRYLDLVWKADGLRLDPDRQTVARRYGLKGVLEASGSVSGPIESLDADAYLNAEGLSVGGRPFTRASATARLRREPGSDAVLVDVSDGRLEGAGGIATFDGFWGSQQGAVSVALDAAGLRMDALADLFATGTGDPTGAAPLRQIADTIGGEVYGHIDVEGTMGDLRVMLDRGRIEKARYRGEPLPVFAGTVEWDQGRNTVDCPEFSLLEAGSVVGGRIRVSLDRDGPLEGEFAGHAVSLMRLGRLLGLSDLANADGALEFRVSAHGTLAAPVLEGSASVDRLALPVQSARARAGPRKRIAVGRVAVEDFRLREGALEIAAARIGEAERALTISNAVVPFAWSQGGFVREGALRASVHLPRQPLTGIPGMEDYAKSLGLAGSAELNVEVGGTLDRPVLEGSAEIADGRLRWDPEGSGWAKVLGGEALEVDGCAIRLAIAPGQGSETARVTVDRAEGRVLGGTLSASGSVGLADLNPGNPRNRFDLALEAADLKVPLFPGPNGQLTIPRARISVAYDPASRRNTVRLDDATARLGDGTITASGQVDLDPKYSSDELGLNLWSVECRLQSIPINAKDLADFAVRTFGSDDRSLAFLDVGSGKLDGTVRVASPGKRAGRPATISGEVLLHDANLRLPALPGGTAQQAVWGLTRDDFVLDLALRSGAKVMIPSIGAPLEGAATLRGTLRSPVIAGRLVSEGGKMALFDRQAQLEHLGLEFQYRVQPGTRLLVFSSSLDIRAVTTVSYRGQDVSIILSVTGPLGETQVRLSSEPAMAQDELLRLLGTGGEAAPGAAGGLSDLGKKLTQNLGATVGELVSQQAVSNIVDRIRTALGLESLKLNIGEGMSVRGFDVETKVSPGLFVRFHEGPSLVADKTAYLLGFKYDLPGKVHLSLETDDTGEIRGGLETHWQF